MLNKGDEVDRYIVEAVLGEGGMAVVYRVRHKTLGTRHALKILQIANREIRERTLQEGQVQAKLRHPHIVAVTDVIEVAGSPGLLMEHVRGPALDHWRYQYQPSIEEILVVFRGVVAGVGHAHAKGLVHRDLKSANIMLQIDDDIGVVPKVTDFGLAKVSRPDGRMTRSGTTMGTPTFMAPEQIRDASSVDRRADLYSLGVILYELVCGRTPHVGDDVLQLFADVASGEFPHPREFRSDIPNNIVDVIDALVEVNANYRLPDCASILELLASEERNTFIASAPTSTEALPPPKPMPDPGVTILKHGSPGAVRAALFLSQLTTPPMVVGADPGSMASIGGWDGGPTVAVDMDRPDPVPTPSPALRPMMAAAFFAPLAIGSGIVVGSFVLLFGLWYQSVPLEAGVAVVPAAAVEPLPPVAPVPSPVAPPAPVLPPSPVVPAVPVAASAPADPTPAPAPVAPAPAPAPVAPSPVPAPIVSAPVPAMGQATFSVVDGTDVILKHGSKSFRPGEALTPGTYVIEAVLDGKRTVAGSVEVREGVSVRLSCDAAFGSCKAR